MDKMYERFIRSGIDLVPVGIKVCKDNTPYFCTPKGAAIFGWAGIDGIHFCFIRGFGNMVFSVNPISADQNYVHPLAKDFTDFLRLILACGNEAALEQAWMWDEAQFEAFLKENPVTQEQKQTLSEISKKLKLTPMEKPWAYIRTQQADFDYSKIVYTEDYYDIDMNPSSELVCPEWKVYYDGNFWVHQGRDHAGKEKRVDKQFDWAGHRWVIPAVYSCSKGLVIDFCMQVHVEEIRSFMKKWNLSSEHDQSETFTCEQQMQMRLDDPLCLEFYPHIELNGKVLQVSHGCSVCYNPCFSNKTVDIEANIVVNHYGLDNSYGWVIYREAFSWEGKRRPEIKTLFVTMEQQARQIPGPHFRVHAPGDSFTFFNPVRQITHTLTVQKIEEETIPKTSFGSDRWIYPTHCVVMSYTFSPEPVDQITIFDCDEGDKPLEVVSREDPYVMSVRACSAVVVGGNSDKKRHTVCSALHFLPVQDDIEWRIVFHGKQFDEASFLII